MPAERRAVLLLLGLAVLGQAIRVWTGRPDAAPGDIRLSTGGPPGAPQAHRDSSIAIARPLAPGERIDLDRAAAIEIARLPRVGLSLARIIVADRAAHGPFGSLEGLDRVPGIGPGLLAAIGGQVRFSGAPRITPPPSSAFSEPLATGSSDPTLLDLNHATAAELERLPFVGPYMAQQIVASRDRHGPFPSVDSLVRVPGVGPATLAKLRSRLRVQ